MTTPSSLMATLATAPPRPGNAGNQSHLIICWQKLAEFCAQYLTKGRLVYVSGRISYRTWEGKDGQKHRATEIVATEVIPLDRKPNGELRVGNSQDDASDLPF